MGARSRMHTKCSILRCTAPCDEVQTIYKIYRHQRKHIDSVKNFKFCMQVRILSDSKPVILPVSYIQSNQLKKIFLKLEIIKRVHLVCVTGPF